MYLFSAIDGDVAIALNDNLTTNWHDSLWFKTLAGDLQAHGRIESHIIQRLIFLMASARICVELHVNQGFDRMNAVAGDLRIFAFCSSDEFAADD